jgi:ParB family chromosome partitioning protein
MTRVQEVRDIKLSDLVIGKAQVRVRSVSKEIDELAESIRVHGLLEPIVVAPTDKEGIYEILTGQRRFLAHQSSALKRSCRPSSTRRSTRPKPRSSPD